MDFDEGFYLASLDALRHGQTLGTEVFAPQPPGFYALLRLAGAVVGPSAEQVRMAFVGLAVIGALGAFALARSLGAGAAALIAPALIVIAPPVPLDAARVWADLPSLWVGLAAAGLAGLAARRGRGEITLAALAGATLVLAISVKLSAALIAPTVVILLLAAPHRRRRLVAAVVGAGTLAAVILLANWRALSQLWQSVIVYHSRASSTPPVLDRSYEIHKLFDSRTPYLWLVVAGAVAFVVAIFRRRVLAGEVAVWIWAAVSFLFLLWFSPLHANHLVYLPVPLATAAAVSLGRALARPSRWRGPAAVAVALALSAGWAQQLHRVEVEPTSNNAVDVAAAAVLDRSTRPSDYVVSDRPAAAVLAHRTVPGPLVELGYLRFETRLATPTLVLNTVDKWCVQAVVAGRSLAQEPAIVFGLRARFKRVVSALKARVFLDPRRSCRR
jgi:4-amino-4-deoxy-L-arabinose transferase-like glycosyltransferase